MNRLIIALATTAALSTGALAQTTAGNAPVATTTQGTSQVPVPGNDSAIESAVPAEAASTVIVPTDAPPASTAENTSQVPVPGNSSGIDSTMPVEAASTVVVPTDATPVPADPAAPVPGNSQGETAIPPAR
ncbi:hypothetical protein [Aureimonas sp. SK2]|uniref:hypothetical protein n=1 Tax=Aureimonas sp. SK2 TaxID=3015992 RepID=UPI00244413B3|nr:hypothetical protein [Aureimonas sp. SK2]